MILLSDVLTLCCTFWLIVLWMSHRTYFLRPSVALLALSVITLLWPHMILRETIGKYTDYANETFLYLVLFILGGLALTSILSSLDDPVQLASSATAHRSSNIPEFNIAQSVYRYGMLVIIAVMALYFLYVPPTQTGLYAILFDPQSSGLARENSLKLIDSALLRYAYLITYSFLAPLVFIIGVDLYYFRKPVKWFQLIAGSLLVSVYIMLTGARAGLAYLAVAWLLLVIMRRGLRFRVTEFIIAGAVFLVFPAIISQMREGVDDGNLSTYIGLIIDRVFLLPSIISAWYLEFANKYGFGGLPSLMGQSTVANLYNAVALEYTERYEPINNITSITAPTAYFVQNFYLFDWIGLLPSWAGLVLMDWPARHIRYLSGPLQASFYAIALFYSIFFLQSGYGIVWITNGYMVFAILIELLSHRFSFGIRLFRNGKHRTKTVTAVPQNGSS